MKKAKPEPLTAEEIKVFDIILSEWHERNPRRIFEMGAGGHLQSILTKLQAMAKVG